MALQIQHNRGDVYKGNLQNFENGQIFWSYINTDPFTSKGHTYSLGQLWVKDPSNEKLTEVANRRSLDSLTFQGWIDSTFHGDFINCSETLFPKFKHCHKGDFWIFTVNNKTDFKVPFLKGDILLITEVVYTEKGGKFREEIDSVEYIKIPGFEFDGEDSDLDVDGISEAIKELENRMYYKGEITTVKEFYKANSSKTKGSLYVVVSPLPLLTSDIKYVEGTRIVKDGHIFLRTGDMLWYDPKDTSKWVLIPTGQDAENLVYPRYTEDLNAIDAVTTFPDSHKEQLKKATTVKEALDVLNITKAGLDKNGKVPFSELPDTLTSGLTLQGPFYPVINKYKEKDDPSNQNPWPEPTDDEYDPVLRNGMFWIVQTEGLVNVQYKDKTLNNRTIELNTGDWVVWVKDRFEVIDNSDRISAIEVTVPYFSKGEKKTLTGVVGFSADNGISVKTIDGETIVFGLSEKTLLLEEDSGKKNYFPKFTGQLSPNTTLNDSEMFQDEEGIHSVIDFFVGSENNFREGNVFGNQVIHKTLGNTSTGFQNNFLIIDSASLLKKNNELFNRYTKVGASDRSNFAEGDENLLVTLPEASSQLLAILKGDSLTDGYIPKSYYDGFMTDTLLQELYKTDDVPDVFEEAMEQGYMNVGIGRTATEDLDTGEITFYSKSKDYTEFLCGFYTQLHSVFNGYSQGADQLEHLIKRNKKGITHLLINPSTLKDEEETTNWMPEISGTLMVWEEFILATAPGIPLMIPAWEQKHSTKGREFVGLDTSPITIKLNRKKHWWTSIDRYNDLAEDYGEGIKSTWSYINSSKENSLQDKKRGSVDDVVSFDSWLEAQRAVATNEAFILPASALKDGNSFMSPDDLSVVKDPKETVNDGYGKDTHGGKYQRIVPSRTLYPEEHVYYDPFTGALKPQNTAGKDVEMPAEGGVLLTSRSRIDGGFWD